jgi:hypothetical protein
MSWGQASMQFLALILVPRSLTGTLFEIPVEIGDMFKHPWYILLEREAKTAALVMFVGLVYVPTVPMN